MTHIRNQLDPLMLQYWAKDPATYEAYRKNRRLYGLPRYEQEDAPIAEPTPQPASISGSGPAGIAPGSEPVAARLDRENRSIFESVLPPSEELYGGQAAPVSPSSRPGAANGNGSTHAVELGG